ncbi:hypothetical protein [Rhizobium phaseoli]|uniref:hypothetical protein n=1 Tax=Rhizobium phaseoli TaxID=396 RepID=UPI000BEA82CA|nr:hypothetical protein [Rhizobium phaseoli]PDS69866.1 hypothetical protein CO651_21875 [Rhizobium phaseoli]
MAEFDWVTFFSGLFGSAITAGGVFYAARQLKLNAKQHESAEEWKRMEFASQLVERLSKDEELAFCARALDWAVGPLIIPEKYRVLFQNKEITIDHDWNKLARAVQPQLDPAGLDPELLVYRYCFDAFGGYLETIARHLELGTVKRDHLVGVGYFLSVLMDAEYYRMLPTSMKLPAVTEKNVFAGFFKSFYPETLPLLAAASAFPGARPPERG